MRFESSTTDCHTAAFYRLRLITSANVVWSEVYRFADCFYTPERHWTRLWRLDFEKSSGSPQWRACRSLVLLLPYCFHTPQRVPPSFAFYLQMMGWLTGLEPATFGATIRRFLFLGVAACCRIGLSYSAL